ncbi:basic leucine zipper 63-like [Nymphaea colorata]|uniref:BZIP domain-containing protein n=1 Tax=Nymphaea colorata TaxID=210225 RepID=A0A5K1G6T1_9MAGN|nr:basic leucine zipper 63-like [Nymphaea colorata]
MDEVATIAYSPAAFFSGLQADIAATKTISSGQFSPGSFSMPYLSSSFQVHSPIQDFATQACSWSSSASDEADEQQNMINDRKQRRMLSNRESARRSRMRKQRLLDELWSQVVHLRSENRELIERLNSLSDQHEQIMRENHCLRKKASDLQQKLSDLHLDPSDVHPDHEEVPCNAAYLRAEMANQHPVTASVDLLH